MILATWRLWSNVGRLVTPIAAARAATTQLRAASHAAPFSSDDDDEPPHSRIGDLLNRRQRDGNATTALWIGQDALMIDAVRKMADTGAAALLVYDAMRAGAEAEAKGAPRDARHCVGIVTERDYLRKVVVAGRSSFTTPVRAIMTPRERVRVLTPADTVTDAMALMVQHDIRNVPVVDGKTSAVVGLLPIKEVVRALLDDQKAHIHELKEFISGTSHNGLP